MGLAVAGFLRWSEGDDAADEVDLIPTKRGGVLDAEPATVANEEHSIPLVFCLGEQGGEFGDGEGSALGGFMP